MSVDMSGNMSNRQSLATIDAMLRFAMGRIAKAEVTPGLERRRELQAKYLDDFLEDIREYWRGFARRNGLAQPDPIEKAAKFKRYGPGPAAFEMVVDWEKEADELARALTPTYEKFLGEGSAQALDDLAARGATVTDVGLTGLTHLGDYDLTIKQSLANLVVRINETTRAQIRGVVATGIEQGFSTKHIANGVEGFPGINGLVNQYYRGRARAIALTETANAYNLGQLQGYRNSGIVERVRIFDGDDCGWTSHDDPDAANGSTRTLEEAEAQPTAHPNCQRSWAPIPIGQTEGVGRTQSPRPGRAAPDVPTRATMPYDAVRAGINPAAPGDDLAMLTEFDRILTTRYGVQEFEIVGDDILQHFSGRHAQSILDGFEAYHAKGVDVGRIVKRFELNNKTVAHSLQKGATVPAEFESATSTMRYYRDGLGKIGKPYGNRSLLGDDGLSLSVQHEMGHALDFGAPSPLRDRWFYQHNLSKQASEGQVTKQLRAATRELNKSKKRIDYLEAREAAGELLPSYTQKQLTTHRQLVEVYERQQRSLRAMSADAKRAETFATDYGSFNEFEDLAEWMLRYLNKPGAMQLEAPNKYGILDDMIEAAQR